jgi:hypothetical protein
MASQDTPGSGERVVVVGLLADPGLPTDLARQVADELPGHLESQVEVSARWDVRVKTRALSLNADGGLPMLEIGQQQARDEEWDLTILLTELPRRAGTEPIVSDYSLDCGVALVSIPALGAFGLRRRVRKVLLHLLAGHLVDKVRHDDSTSRQGDADCRDRRPLGLGAPVHHLTSEDDGIDEHLGLRGARGRLRLLAGMVRANRPWRLVPSLSPAIAGALAGAAFGVFYSNIWQLATAFPGWRLALVNVLAVVAMIVWLIVDNNLWERPANRRLREEAVLYNAATALTISIGVVCMYLVLFVGTFVAALVVIPGDYLASTINHPAGLVDFLMITWLSTSMGTIAGALGSGLASEEAVRQAAYSKREQERRANLQDEGAGDG